MPVNMPIAAMQYDVNGRLTGMTMDDQNGQGPQPFASASYYATGQLNTLSWGGYTETRTYNSLMQLITQSVPGAMNMTYNYSTTLNNGRITSSVDGVTGENTTYSYDALNRLTNASNSLWSEAYTYDGFGNLTSKAGSGGSPNPAPTVSMTYNSQNQLTNLYYDANGNQNAYYTIYGGNTYSVENRLTFEVLQNSGSYPANIYAYDPWGKRVMSGYDPSPYSSHTQPNYSYTFYGITGQKLAMVTCNGSNYPSYPTCAIVGQNVYFGKKLITAGGVSVVTDRLGSVRANGQGESAAYYPYGEERTSTVDGREKFGTYFRDAIGQDYADQRYYGSGTGSFWGVDAGPANLGDPTTWNRYGYATGDPVNNWDPPGMADCPAGQVCIFYFPPSPGPFGGGGVGGSGGRSPIACAISGLGPEADDCGEGDGGGGGAGSFSLTVTGYSRSGPNETKILHTLIIAQDEVVTGDCASWLESQGVSASDLGNLFDALENSSNGGPTVGWGALNYNNIAAFVGGNNPDGSPVPGLPADATITVNSNGAFFSSSLSVGSGATQYNGGTLQAQLFILIHELGHLTGVLQPDTDNSANENSNNSAVQSNCGKQIAGAK